MRSTRGSLLSLLLGSLLGIARAAAPGDDAPAIERALPGQVGMAALGEELWCAIGRAMECDIALAKAYGLIETGLRPRFPAGLSCPDIDEQYAISYSSKRGREQYHGGIDMPAPRGTPIVAAADGVVVGKYDGVDSYRGRELILRHSPEETGFPVWIYTQYAHFDIMPTLEVGDRVKLGQELGLTGNSGIGRNGGQSNKRRPAIHFAAWFSPDPRYVALRGKIVPLAGRWLDPNALYLPRDSVLDSSALKTLPEARKQVDVAVMRDAGAVVPAGAKTIWPYRCSPR